MATITWQPLVITICCLFLDISSVLSKTAGPLDQAGVPNSLANSQLLDYHRKTYPLDHYESAANRAGSLSDDADSSSLAPDYYNDRLQQPKVYQSTMDRIVGPARQASNVQASTSVVGDLNTAAGHHHGHHHHHGKYYEYREVPKKKTWKFGYKRGNHKHHIERHEHGKAGKHPHFKTKVKWADKKSKGKGIHLWDYNHHDKKHYHHHHG